MYLREAPAQTLSDLMDTVESSPVSTLTLSPGEVHVNVPERTIDLGGREFRLGKTGLESLAATLDIPAPFLVRQEPEFQQTILEHLLSRKTTPDAYAVSETEGLVEVRNPNTQVIAPARLIGATIRVIDGQAPVRDFWSDSSEFRLDVFAPEGFDRGIGGDVRVGDISAAGIRINQNRKHNLAPTVQPFSYRFFCTNGMSTRHDGLKIDARGQTVDEVLAEFESMADLAFRRAEAEIASLYEMRSEIVENPERTLLRMATEAGLPDRTVTRLLERLPASEDRAHDDRWSMFDLVNLMTNQANDPTQRRAGHRLALESAAGGTVANHADRCGHCQSRLTH